LLSPLFNKLFYSADEIKTPGYVLKFIIDRCWIKHGENHYLKSTKRFEQGSILARGQQKILLSQWFRGIIQKCRSSEGVIQW